MEELRELAKDGPVADFIDHLTPEHVSGVSLKVDDYWLSWQTGVDWLHRYAIRPYPQPAFGPMRSQREMRMFFGATYDFRLRPPDWDRHCKNKGLHWNAHPVSVVVILREPATAAQMKDAQRVVGEHPIVYEHRATAFAQALRAGDTVHGRMAGTLGGYLWNSADTQHYAISCEHVLGPAGNTVNAGRSVVGKVIQSVPPRNLTGKCNNRIQPNGNSVDVAVADLSGQPTIDLTQPTAGKITRCTPIANIGPGDPVVFTGKTSGTVRAKVKECNVWKEIIVSGQAVCFGDLLVLEDLHYQHINHAVSQPGDSGAWVLSTGSGVVGWDAMLIGGDGTNSYCSYAENVMASIDPNLRIPP